MHPLSDNSRILPIKRTSEILHAPPEFMLVVSYNHSYQNLLKGMKPPPATKRKSYRSNCRRCMRC